jgi:hypothetical protein
MDVPKQNIQDISMIKCKNSGLCNGEMRTDKMKELETMMGIPCCGNPKKCSNCNI